MNENVKNLLPNPEMSALTAVGEIEEVLFALDCFQEPLPTFLLTLAIQ